MVTNQARQTADDASPRISRQLLAGRAYAAPAEPRAVTFLGYTFFITPAMMMWRMDIVSQYLNQPIEPSVLALAARCGVSGWFTRFRPPLPLGGRFPSSKRQLFGSSKDRLGVLSAISRNVGERLLAVVDSTGQRNTC